MNAVNWFDLVILLVLITGLLIGRKRGMSQELIPLLQWITIIAAASLLYEPLGDRLSTKLPFSKLSLYVSSYIGIAIILKIIFTYIKRAAGEKLLGSDVFGGAEYYLGIVAGILHAACIVIMFLALVHARLITQQEREEMARFQKQNFEGVSFPTFGSFQTQVFQGSLTGTSIERLAPKLLIKPTVPEFKSIRNENSAGSRRQGEVDQAIRGR